MPNLLHARASDRPNRRILQRLAAPVALSAVVLLSTVAASAEADAAAANPVEATATTRNSGPSERQAVIPPGQEEALAAMLGRGADLPAGCHFARAQVDGSLITSTYGCSEAEVVIELHHPSAAPAGATETAQFALLLRQGVPPEGFLDGLLARVRAHENTVTWTWTEADVVPAKPVGFRRLPTLLLAIAILGVWLWWRRARSESAG